MVGTLLLLALAGSAAAATVAATPPVPPTPAPAPPVVSRTAPHATPAPTGSLAGQVVGVDLAAGLVTIRETVGAPRSGREAVPVTLRVDAASKVVKGKRPASLADVHAGDHAVARYQVTATGRRALTLRVADTLVPPAVATPTPPPTIPVGPQ